MKDVLNMGYKVHSAGSGSALIDTFLIVYHSDIVEPGPVLLPKS